MSPRPTIAQQIEQGYALLREGRLPEANATARVLVQRAPDNAAALVFASESRLASNDTDGALAFIARAIDASGGDASLMLKKASLLAHVRRRADAVTMAGQAAAQRPGNGMMYWRAGALLGLCNRHSLALDYYRTARGALGDVAPLLYDIAVAQFFTGDLEGAEANLDKLLAAAPAAGHAHYLRSTLRRQTPSRNHVSVLEQRLEAGFDSPGAEAAALYALAKELEDLGEHASAFSTLARAAATMRGTLKYDVSVERASMQALMDAYTGDQMAAGTRSNEGAGAVFIVGMPRTGTTLVERILVQQGVVKSAGELLDFGNLVALSTQRILDGGSNQSSARASLLIDFPTLGREYLRGAREAAMGSESFIDKMPVNFLYCGLIGKALPNAKIIHLRRDPLDSCYAVYKTLFFNAYHFSYGLEELAEYYVAYDRLMRHWHDVMPGAILDVDYEELVSSPEAQGRRIFEWCGLRWDPAVLQASPDQSAFVTASASQVREPIHQRSVRSSRRHLDALAPLVARLAKAGIRVD